MPIIPFENLAPRIHPSAFIAPNAIILGDVEIGEESTVWYGCVLRGDLDPIRIGRRTNIQDNTVIHTGKGEPCIIHDEVTVGHAAIVHGCEVKNNALIGMGACVLNRAVIGEECIVGAKALVTEDKKFEARCLIAGVPAKFVRRLSDADLAQIRVYMLRYVENGKRHRAAIERWAADPR
ncbi:gamma carbonic anhydrase family protein [Candidatus Sumerlaeota bacterium]|nr:gamma carbonic anhydrase family protein [Candidatus Sumerlaeota bacterium]